MPNESLREQIMQYAEALIGGILKSDGYWYDIDPEQIIPYFRPLEDVPSDAMPFLMLSHGDEDNIHHKSFREDLSNFEIIVSGYMYSKDPREARKKTERLIQDVRKKLLSDPSFGNLIRTIYINNVVTDEGELALQGFGLFIMSVGIEYRYLWTSP